eukprot:jgi/Mesvir1/23985/Mv10745-RA.1
MTEITWQLVSSSPAGLGGRAGHTATLVTVGSQRKLLVIGGRRNEDFFNDVWIYDVESGAWERVHRRAPFKPRAYHSATLIKGFLWLIGGSNNDEVFGDVHVLDTSTLQWFKPSLHNETLPRTAHAAVVHPLKPTTILVFGGYGGAERVKYMGDLTQLVTDANIWEPVAVTSGSSPCARAYHTFSALGNHCILFGGKTSGGVIKDNVFCVYDAIANRWLPDRPQGPGDELARSNHAAAVVGEDPPTLVVHGGRMGEVRFTDVHVLPWPTGEAGAASAVCRVWRKWEAATFTVPDSRGNPRGPERMEGRAAQSLTSLGDALLMFGGYGGQGRTFDTLFFCPKVPGIQSGSTGRASAAAGLPPAPLPFVAAGNDMPHRAHRLKHATREEGQAVSKDSRMKRVGEKGADADRQEGNRGDAWQRTDSLVGASCPYEPEPDGWKQSKRMRGPASPATVTINRQKQTLLLHSTTAVAAVTSDSGKEIEECRRQLREALQAQEVAEKELRRCQEQQLKTTEEMDALRSKLHAAKVTDAMWVTISDENRKLERHIQEKLAELQQAAATCKRMEEKAAVDAAQNSQLQREKEELATCLKQCQAERGQLQAKLEAKEQELEAALQQIALLEQERLALDKLHADVQRSLERVTAERTSLQEQKTLMQQNLESVSKRLEKEELRRETLDRECDNLRRDREALRVARVAAETEMEKVQSKMDIECASLRATLSRAEAERDQAKQVSREQLAQYETLLAERNELSSMLQKAHADVAKAHTDLSKKVEEVSDMRTKIRDWDEADKGMVRMLTDRIRDRKEKFWPADS